MKTPIVNINGSIQPDLQSATLLTPAMRHIFRRLIADLGPLCSVQHEDWAPWFSIATRDAARPIPDVSLMEVYSPQEAERITIDCPVYLLGSQPAREQIPAHAADNAYIFTFDGHACTLIGGTSPAIVQGDRRRAVHMLKRIMEHQV